MKKIVDAAMINDLRPGGGGPLDQLLPVFVGLRNAGTGENIIDGCSDIYTGKRYRVT